MDRDKLFSFYKELYLRELEVRHKTDTRIQISLAIMLAMLGAGGFLLENIDRVSTSPSHSVFWITFYATCLSLGVTMFNFARAFWGHEYMVLPSLLETDQYRSELERTYARFANQEELVEKYFYDFLILYLTRCDGVNSSTNDRKALFLHHCNSGLIVSATALLLSFAIFYYYDLRSVP